MSNLKTKYIDFETGRKIRAVDGFKDKYLAQSIEKGDTWFLIAAFNCIAAEESERVAVPFLSELLGISPQHLPKQMGKSGLIRFAALVNVLDHLGYQVTLSCSYPKRAQSDYFNLLQKSLAEKRWKSFFKMVYDLSKVWATGRDMSKSVGLTPWGFRYALTKTKKGPTWLDMVKTLDALGIDLCIIKK